MEKLFLEDVLREWPVHDNELIAYVLDNARSLNNAKIVVLDDDPTGVQTVHDVNVYTNWSYESVLAGFREEKKMFYILTNSRSFTSEETRRAHEEIACNVVRVSEELQREYILVSRGDSTLRGHWPLETETLRETIERMSSIVIDGEVIAPFFKEGGRYTINNIHYVNFNGILVPAGETEFARDQTFGYISSHLGEWVEEKSHGRYKKENLCYVGLKDLRSCNFDDIERQLLNVRLFNKVIVNSLDLCDIQVFCAALYKAINKGKHFLLRTASSLPKVLAGICDRPFLTREELLGDKISAGGLVIVGSHVKKTTEQLEELKTCDFIHFIEFNQHLILEPEKVKQEIDRVIKECNIHLARGKTVVVYTRRQVFNLGTSDKEEELKASVKVSHAITQIVEGIKVRPAFIVAKGGITSSDIGVKGLKVKRAMVLGQILDGVPVWRIGEESRFPGMPYVIFPGNVGDKTALKEAVMILCGK
ncbi:hypothetical protein Anamo_2029 [Acetomicrobium mobile DSM 13181]|uniref:Hydroxyacid dehydrogenase n=1 Tax=Acetomicrobium mobile (strain ATCC BAA-54 / DSM 13181 / JCM 12221 / NGA) TaxID=891968 RepID=I4BZA5_ACEMN|nr:hypothetical protein Anamo_2029 [Acetomicrobium mobile DSM 13181]